MFDAPLRCIPCSLRTREYGTQHRMTGKGGKCWRSDPVILTRVFKSGLSNNFVALILLLVLSSPPALLSKRNQCCATRRQSDIGFVIILKTLKSYQSWQICMHALQLDWLIWIRFVYNIGCRRAAASCSRGRAMILCVLHGSPELMFSFHHLSPTAAAAVNCSHFILLHITVCVRTLVALRGSFTRTPTYPLLYQLFEHTLMLVLYPVRMFVA